LDTFLKLLEAHVAVGEMQMKLLQKVEELTLYVIEQNKQRATQVKELAQMLCSGMPRRSSGSR
jgi:hypothetical protein